MNATRTKTDQLDAAMLAELGARLLPEPTPMPAREHRDLKDLAVARAAMVRRRTAAKAQRSTSGNTIVQELLAEEIAEFDKRIDRIDSAIDQHIAASEQLARRSGILCSIPGIGPGTAAAILAWMPEVGTLSAGEVGALERVSSKWTRKPPGSVGVFRGMRETRKMRHACLMTFSAPSVILGPPHATPFMACGGGGEVVTGLVVLDRIKVWSTAVFATGLNH